MYLRTELEKVLEEPVALRAPLVEVKPYTLEHLAQWIATREADEWYNFASAYDCLLCQYASGVEGAKVSFSTPAHEFGRLIDDACTIAYGRACEGPHTFGAALNRARSFLQATAKPQRLSQSNPQRGEI